MATPQQAEKYRANQARIAALVAGRVQAFFAANDPNDPRFPGLLREFVRAVVESYGPFAAAIAADYYDMLRDAADVPGSYLAEPGEYLQSWDLLALQKVAEWALQAPSPVEMQARLARRLAKHVQQWGRDTVTDNAKKDPARVRFARVPEGKTCAFCLMLAAKGAVFHTAHDAGELNEFHDGCDCQIVPVFPGEKLPYDAAKLSKLYSEARGRAGSGDTSAILAEFRKYADVTDATKENPHHPGYVPWSGHAKGYEHPHRQPIWSEQERVERQGALAMPLAGEQLYQHEIEAVERLQSNGQTVEWLAKNADRSSSNDFLWTNRGGIPTELKSVSTRPRTIRDRIKNAVLSARKHGVTKDVFILDFGPRKISLSLRAQLINYNRNRLRDHPGGGEEPALIRELWVISENGHLEQIPLAPIDDLQ